MRTAYKVRAYPNPEQAGVLNRTFGCVRVVWNRILAARQTLYAMEHKSMSYKDTDAALTAMKKYTFMKGPNEPIFADPEGNPWTSDRKQREDYFYPALNRRRC